MTVLLHIESSARGLARSHSRRLAGRLVAELAGRHQGAEIVVRDLAASPLPHVDEAFVHAMFTPPEERTASDRAALALSDQLIPELSGADIVVIGVPMYNYGVPSALKAWIDHVVRARVTFRHTPEGPVGLLADRPVHLVTSAGGIYREAAAANDFLTPYLLTILAKIGLHSVTVTAAHGMALGEVVAGAELTAAGAHLASILGARQAA